MEKKPWIRNTDKEVECFHPVCSEALQKALASLGIEERYQVQHHRHVGTIEMDLVIANKEDNRILCVVEVKRTIAAVNSTRFQYQAMSYMQSLRETELESNYFMLTNLESSCLFKFDQRRPNVYEQIIEPGIQVNHRFSEVTKEVFLADLIEQYKTYLTIVLNDTGEYLLSFKMFAHEIENKLSGGLPWQKTLVALFYSYIRGAFTKLDRGNLKSISQLSYKADLICREALSINFKDIFTLPPLTGGDREIDTSKPLLEQLFKLGRTYVDADELAGVMHKIISNGKEHEGEVATDPELSMMLLCLAKSVGGELRDDEFVMDPAAGSGSLLCSAATVFEGIKPVQLIANDINPMLLQLLSLRLGMKFASTVGKENTVSISIRNVAEMEREDFINVKYIVMNPPFLAATGRNCQRRKMELYCRIEQLKGEPATTVVGQMPLEGVFIELVSTLAAPNAIIAAIIPNTHLTTKGEASVAIRRMLMDEFGLQVVFNYPQEHLFKEVAQNTSIVIGVKGSQSKAIKFLSCSEVITEVDLSNVAELLRVPLDHQQMTAINNDFEGRMVSRDKLSEACEDGWYFGSMLKQEAKDFIREHLTRSLMLASLSDSSFSGYRRGEIGNDGCTDLLFLKRKDSFLNIGRELLSGHLMPGLNNAKYNAVDVGEGESLFVNVSGMTDRKVHTLVRSFLNEKAKSTTRQRRDEKTEDDYVEILKKESAHLYAAHSVMLPRSLRATGRVFVASRPTFVSTNFFVIPTASAESAKILSSWFSTVFYQLECETFGNNRKGLRKMEKADYEPLHVPILSEMSEEQKELIVNTPFNNFLDLRNPSPRKIDHAWAKVLFGDKAMEQLDKALTLLAQLSAMRER